ncbi:MAG: sulfurtransferase [Vicinamibacterales bacterium]
MHTTLIDPVSLMSCLHDPEWVVLDARFDLTAPARGEALYSEGHVPGARYVNLDTDLSGPKIGTTGRHPLPDPATAAATFGRLGIGNGTQVVVYDADAGSFAARVWWMLRWLGHEQVAVLDGGLAAWTRAGLALSDDEEHWEPATFVPAVQAAARVGVGEVLPHVEQSGHVLVDARANDRFRGQNETLDPVAGHIPGAVNRFFQQNLTADKTFKSPDELRAEWTPILGGTDATKAVMYCGSGVTACHNLLALEHAGLSGARLFAGSWSEWCADPGRPVATGDQTSG